MSRFVWHELMTRDVEAAKGFYAEVMGWSYDAFSPGGMEYWIFQAAGVGWGGMATLPPGAGAPPNWLPYVGVESADAVADRVRAGGGHVHVEPTDIPEVGRFTVAVDPQGAAFAAIAPTGEQERPDVPPPGGVAWTELLTNDLGAAVGFYESVFGWTTRTEPMPTGAYTLFQSEGKDVAGAFDLPEQAAAMGAPPHWMTYFAVADAAAAVATATGLGAKQLYEPMAVPGVGTIVGLMDPQGAAFSLLQPQR